MLEYLDMYGKIIQQMNQTSIIELVSIITFNLDLEKQEKKIIHKNVSLEKG